MGAMGVCVEPSYIGDMHQEKRNHMNNVCVPPNASFVLDLMQKAIDI